MKNMLIYFIMAFAVFLICCIIMVFFGSELNNRFVVIMFMATWGVSALLWPVFGMRAFKEWATKLTK